MDPDQPPDPLDALIGRNLRSLRLLTGRTQGWLGARVDVSAQQIGKYERGEDRLSAPMLFRIARALDARIARFFQGASVDAAPEGALGVAEPGAMFDRAGAPEAPGAGFRARMAAASLPSQRRALRAALLELDREQRGPN